MKFNIIVICLCIAVSGFAQEDVTVKKLKDETARTLTKNVTDTTNWKWLKGGSININGTQGSLHNWAAGGDKFSLAINSYLNYFAYYRKGKKTWDNNLDFYYGMIQSTSLGVRKNDDRLDFLSKYGHNLSSKWFLSGLLNFRTQFFHGYSYTDTSKVFSSSFLSPAYLLLSVGLDYKANVNFSAFISPVTSRLTIVSNKELAAQGLYGVPPGHNTYNEFGAFATINYTLPLATNIAYKGRVDLFSNYSHNPGNVDLYMTNFLAFKINKYFQATYNLDLIYDDDIRLFGKDANSAGLQLKSLIGLGVTMKL